tara:strand:+ start:3722 stop:4210 length:489 start_codon:yes stop_codon:yes gene_type:complete
MNLRELTQDQQEILAQVESEEFSIDDVSDHLNMLESERNKKIESYLHVINRLSSEEVTITAELDRLNTIRYSKEKALKNIKSWLLMSMQDGEKHEFDLFKVSRVKGREVLQINDGDKVPVKYKECRPESWHIDKRTLLAELKKGKEVTGAEISIGNPILRIK